MDKVIIAFFREEDADRIRRIALRAGCSVFAVCTSGAAVLQAADRLGDGIVVCGYRLKDMLYDHLYGMLEGRFEMILLASERVIEEGIPCGVKALQLPLQAQVLADTLEEAVLGRSERIRQRKRTVIRQRSPEERQLIEQAKALLMERRGISEEEAHRYLQKTSMENGTNLPETASMILSLLKR